MRSSKNILENIRKDGSKNKEFNFGYTRLERASNDGKINMVKGLLKLGADVKKVGSKKIPALHLASLRGHKDIVKVLLKAGAEMNKVDREGYTPLLRAIRNGHDDIAMLLLKAGAKDEVKYRGLNAFELSSVHSLKNVMEFLLDKGANVNSKIKFQDDEMTPLHLAVMKNKSDVVRMLIRKGADINLRSRRLQTPLHLAAIHNVSKDILEMLLKKGADINSLDHHLQTPLFHAASRGYKDLVEFLLSKGSDPTLLDNKKLTAIHYTTNPVIKKLIREKMGIKTPWRNMNNNERKTIKPLILEEMVRKVESKKLKNFTEPILFANYSYKTLKPVNKGNKTITSFGLVINNKNQPQQIIDAEGAKKSMKITETIRNKATIEGKPLPPPLPGVIFENWSLVNFTKKEYNEAMKSVMKSLKAEKRKRNGNVSVNKKSKSVRK